MLNELCICFHTEALSRQCSATGEEGVGHGSDGPSDGIYILQSGTTARSSREREMHLPSITMDCVCASAPSSSSMTLETSA